MRYRWKCQQTCTFVKPGHLGTYTHTIREAEGVDARHRAHCREAHEACWGWIMPLEMGRRIEEAKNTGWTQLGLFDE